MSVVWTHADVADLAATEALIEDVLRDVRPHPVVVEYLRGQRTYLDHPYPRCEAHENRYLFVVLHLPTSITDGNTTFDEIIVVADREQVWTVLRPDVPEAEAGPVDPDEDNPLAEMLGRERERAERRAEANGMPVPELTLPGIVNDLLGRAATLADPGDFLRAVFDAVVDALEVSFAITGETIHDFVDALTEFEALVIQDRTQDLSRELRITLPRIRQHAITVRREIASLGTIVDQLAVITQRIADDEIDLTAPSRDEQSELFGQDTEIWMHDVSVRSQRLSRVQDDQLERLNLIVDSIHHLDNADQTTSNRFMGAIASIMLLPTFIVGFYGMNFKHMPEINWVSSYIALIVIIVGVTLFQIWFFRRRRWL